MRSAVAATLAVLAGLTVANMLGVASAEAPTTTSLRTVTVEGVATTPIDVKADREEADAAYRQAMASAMSDGQSKAEFLAGKAGGTLGPVQSIAERGGSISCSEGEDEEGYTLYVAYRGEQPDFGGGNEGETFAAAPKAATAPLATPKAKKKKKRKPVAKKASADTCTLSAQVGLVYALQ